jgi:hypothetical protein
MCAEPDENILLGDGCLTGEGRTDVKNLSEEHVLEALFQEYKQLGASVDKHVAVCYNVPPIVLTIMSGFFFLSGANPGPLLGFGVTLSGVFLLVWLGMIQSMMNNIGVQLVDLEIRINAMLSLKSAENPVVGEHLTYYRRVMGRGFDLLPGFRIYSLFLALLISIVLIPVSMKSWSTMSSWGFGWYLKLPFVGIPMLMMIAVVATMRHVERITVRRIEEKVRDAAA